MNALTSFFQSIQQFFSANPSVAMLQLGMIAVAALLVFLVFFATRDIMLRTHSFGYQLLCIVLVAALPVLGFFLYLLIRPSRTNQERHMEHLLHEAIGKADRLQAIINQQKKGQQGQGQQQKHEHKHHDHRPEQKKEQR